jgi:hypothetical protein
MLNEGIKCLNSQNDKEFYSDFESVVLLYCLNPESGMSLCNTTLIGLWNVNGLLIIMPLQWNIFLYKTSHG